MGYAPGPEHPGLSAWLARGAARPSLRRAMRELAQGYAVARYIPQVGSS
jgi:glutathione S-transferase